MTTNSTNALPDGTFVTTFVPAKNGLQTEQRINGRRAFPGRQRPQPKAGETWRIAVSGENPTQTVYFVKCIEQVAAPIAIKEVKVPVEDADQHDDLSTQSDAVKANEVPASRDKELVNRAKSWLTKPRTVNMANLREGFAHRCIDADVEATALRNELQGVMDEFESLSAQSQSITDHLQAKYWWQDRDFAERLYSARQVMACRKLQAKELQTQTLAYGRLVQKLRAQADSPDAELVLRVIATKFSLENSRETHNQNMSSAKAELEEVELEYTYLDIDKRVFCKGVEVKDLKIADADQGSVDEILPLLKERAGYEDQKTYIITMLESAVTALEERVAVIVK